MFRTGMFRSFRPCIEDRRLVKGGSEGRFEGFGKAVVVTMTSIAALTACGSDNNVPTAGQARRRRGLRREETLKASGASSQANAMTRFVTAYEAACPVSPSTTPPVDPVPGSRNSSAPNRHGRFRFAAERGQG